MTLWEISDDTTVEIMKDFYAPKFRQQHVQQDEIGSSPVLSATLPPIAGREYVVSRSD